MSLDIQGALQAMKETYLEEGMLTRSSINDIKNESDNSVVRTFCDDVLSTMDYDGSFKEKELKQVVDQYSEVSISLFEGWGNEYVQKHDGNIAVGFLDFFAPDDEARLKIINRTRVLCTNPDSHTISELSDAVEADQNYLIRNAAACALCAIAYKTGYKEPRIAVKNLLMSDDTRVQRAITIGIEEEGSYGTSAYGDALAYSLCNEITKQLQNPDFDPMSQVTLAHLYGNIRGPKNPSILVEEALINHMQSDDKDIVLAALENYSRYDLTPDSANKELTELLYRSDSEISGKAAQILARLGTKAGQKVLHDAIFDRRHDAINPDMRTQAIEAYAWIADHVERKDTTDRAQIRKERICNVMTSLITDPAETAENRFQAVGLLTAIDDSSLINYDDIFQYLAGTVIDPSLKPDVVSFAIRSLGVIKHDQDQCARVLTKALSLKNSKHVNEAITALGCLSKSPRAFNVLEKIVEGSDDQNIVMAAMDAMHEVAWSFESERKPYFIREGRVLSVIITLANSPDSPFNNNAAILAKAYEIMQDIG